MELKKIKSANKIIKTALIIVLFAFVMCNFAFFRCVNNFAMAMEDDFSTAKAMAVII